VDEPGVMHLFNSLDHLDTNHLEWCLPRECFKFDVLLERILNIFGHYVRAVTKIAIFDELRKQSHPILD